jgi:hypothetical protein
MHSQRLQEALRRRIITVSARDQGPARAESRTAFAAYLQHDAVSLILQHFAHVSNKCISVYLSNTRTPFLAPVFAQILMGSKAEVDFLDLVLRDA